MKLTLTLAAVLSFPVLAMSAQMSMTVGGASSPVPRPGDTLSIVLAVDTQGAMIAAFDGYFRSDVEGVLTISNYRLNAAFGFPTYTAPPNGPVTSTNHTQNIGGLSFSDLGPGIVPLATFDVTLSPDWTGTPCFTCTIFEPLLSDGAGHPVPVAAAALTSCPDPAGVLLLGMAAVCLRGRRSERSIP